MSTNKLPKTDIAEILRQAGIDDKAISVKQRRQLPETFTRTAFFFWLACVAVISFGIGGTKVAWHYQDQINGTTQVAEAPTLGK